MGSISERSEGPVGWMRACTYEKRPCSSDIFFRAVRCPGEGTPGLLPDKKPGAAVPAPKAADGDRRFLAVLYKCMYPNRKVHLEKDDRGFRNRAASGGIDLRGKYQHGHISGGLQVNLWRQPLRTFEEIQNESLCGPPPQK